MIWLTTRSLFLENSSPDGAKKLDESDLDAIAELLGECEAVDCLDEPISISDLRHRFNAPSSNGFRDVRLWEDADGKLIAIGQLSIPELPVLEHSPTALEGDEKIDNAIDGSLWFRVRPSARNQGIEEKAIDWGEGRMREIAGEFSTPAKLLSEARDNQTERIALLSNRGFVPLRYFERMSRSLREPFPEPQLPPGFTIVLPPETETTPQQTESRFFPLASKNRQDYLEAWTEMFNQSFIDHWHHRDLTAEEIEYAIGDPHYRPELNLLAVAADGKFAAFCYCYINREDNDRSGCQEGWISALGTRRGFRKLGLGRAMLLAGMQQLKAAGMKKALLDVDAENPSGAMGFYESVGFRKFRTDIVYVKEL